VGRRFQKMSAPHLLDALKNAPGTPLARFLKFQPVASQKLLKPLESFEIRPAVD
jgi:hypothetical protein